MEDIRVDGRLQRVFVLRKTDDSVVYIPLTVLTHTDYQRLLGIEAKGGEMLAQMRKETLDNGRNALVLYDDLIEVVRLEGKGSGNRLLKPEEGGASQHQNAPTTEEQKEEKPAPRKKPGPKPKNRGQNATQ